MDSGKTVLNEGANTSEATAADTQPSRGAVNADTETQSVAKRSVNLTQRSLLLLQKTEQASNLKTTTQGLSCWVLVSSLNV